MIKLELIRQMKGDIYEQGYKNNYTIFSNCNSSYNVIS